jgi:L-alanine-DL-glutamate epimerase-like enolase superfamily enzyme
LIQGAIRRALEGRGVPPHVIPRKSRRHAQPLGHRIPSMLEPDSHPRIEAVAAAAYRVPTEQPESDGTLEWDATTIVLARAASSGITGIGYSYTHHAAAELINHKLSKLLDGMDALAVPKAWHAMIDSVRNIGRPGLASAAIAAVDTALWDLKARLLGLPLVQLLGRSRDSVPVYGSGGFTNYSLERLAAQLREWSESGIGRVKMKVGSEPAADAYRVRAVRDALGPEVELFVDANGAYDRKQALAQAEQFAQFGVSWFEEPVASDDLEGLRLLRDRGPAGMAIAAGEYGYDLFYFRRMLAAGAVDVLQADATRCAGITEFLRVGALCQAHGIPLSAHTAPALHLHPCCALSNVRHIEYFHDHVLIEQALFEGFRQPARGQLAPDLSRHGLGLALREEAARSFTLVSDKDIEWPV